MTKRELASLRAEIERIDSELVQLIGERREVSREIGLVKQKEGAQVRDRARESEVVSHLARKALQVGADSRLASRIGRELIEDSVKTQQIPQKLPLRGEKALVVGGAGRMGEWTCRFLSDRGAEVAVWDPRGRLAGYTNLKSIDEGAEGSDMIVIASPLGACASDLEAVLESSPKGLIFDLCSVKSHIARALTTAARKGFNITSVHPMFGPSAPSPRNRNVLVCSCGCKGADEKAAELFAKSGANVSVIGLEKHDEMMAYVLGLSHLCAMLFGTTLQRAGRPIGAYSKAEGPSFRKLSKMARELSGESKRVYHDIQTLNPNTRELIESMEHVLGELKRAALDKDHAKFGAIMESNREYLEVK